jgi:uncharacterized membrane protein YheB (UPF0754 family)
MDFKNFLPLIVAPLLGWVTNYLAVRMLFRPHAPPKFKFLSWMQGVIPSRRDVLAEKIGSTIEEQLITRDDMHEIVRKMDVKRAIEGTVGDIIDRELDKLMIPIPLSWNMVIRRKILKKIELDVYRITEDTIPELLEKVDIGEIVKNRINQFSNEDIEQIVTNVADKELKHIVWLGGFIGLVVGILQTIINISL